MSTNNLADFIGIAASAYIIALQLFAAIRRGCLTNWHLHGISAEFTKNLSCTQIFRFFNQLCWYLIKILLYIYICIYMCIAVINWNATVLVYFQLLNRGLCGLRYTSSTWLSCLRIFQFTYAGDMHLILVATGIIEAKTCGCLFIQFPVCVCM